MKIFSSFLLFVLALSLHAEPERPNVLMISIEDPLNLAAATLSPNAKNDAVLIGEKYGKGSGQSTILQ